MNPFEIVTHVPPFLHGSLKQRLWPEFQEQKLSVSLFFCFFVFLIFMHTRIYLYLRYLDKLAQFGSKLV